MQTNPNDKIPATFAGPAPCDTCLSAPKCAHLHLACPDFEHYLNTNTIQVLELSDRSASADLFDRLYR